MQPTDGSGLDSTDGTDGADADLEVSVVIPCLDEEKTVALCIDKAHRAFRQRGIRGEVVVADNGSQDRSREVAARAGARVVPCIERGYGAALRAGFLAARGRYVVMGDADDSYDFGELGRFVELLRAGHPFVMGTRLRGRIHPGAMPLLNRYLGTPVLTLLLNLLFGPRISDCNCGMRGIDRQTLLSLGLVSPGMELASEMIIRAAILRVPIVEVPISLHPDKRDRPPHLRPWRDGWRHLRFLLWYAPDRTLTWPGLLMLALGLLLTLSQVAGAFTAFGLLFDLHYMILGLTVSLLGMSALSMGLSVSAFMPRSLIRSSPRLDGLKRWFTFNRAAVAAVTLAGAGLLCDSVVLGHWLQTHRGPLSPGYTRLSLAGLLLIAIGCQTFFLGLLVGLGHSEQARRAGPG